MGLMDFSTFKQKFEKRKVVEVYNKAPSEPKVTVCVQTYQHVNFIRECLESILNQRTDFKFELLLGEDNSTDGTREICIEYANKYPHVIRLFLHHRENNISIEGRATGRFILMTNLYSAKGKYVAMCDGDDSWKDALKLQKQVDFLEKNENYSIVFHDAYVVNEHSQILHNSKLQDAFKKDLSTYEIQKGASLLTLTLCFRNLLQKYPEEITRVYNADTIIICLLGDLGGGKFMPEINPAAYRIHSGGIWSELNKMKQREISIRTYSFLRNYNIKNKELYSHFDKKIEKNFRLLLSYYSSHFEINSFYRTSIGFLVDKNYKYSYFLKVLIYFIKGSIRYVIVSCRKKSKL